MYLYIHETHWDTPIVEKVARVDEITEWRMRPTSRGEVLRRERCLVIGHTDGKVERFQLNDGMTVHVGRDLEDLPENALRGWREGVDTDNTTLPERFKR